MSNNTSECGWPERDFLYIWKHPGFEYTDIVLRPIWLLICTVGNITNILLLRRIRTFQATFLVSVAFFDLVFITTSMGAQTDEWAMFWTFQSIIWVYSNVRIRGVATYLAKPSVSPKGPLKRESKWSWMALYVRDRVGTKNIHGHSVWAFLVTCEFLGNVSAQVSDWVLVAFSLTRLLTIVDPFGMVTRFTTWKMRILVTSLIPFAAAANLFPVVDYATAGNKAARDTWIKDWGAVQDVGDMAAPVSTFFAMLFINSVVVGLLMKRHMLTRASSGQGVGSVIESRKFAMNVTRTSKGVIRVRSHGKEKRTATTVRLLTAAIVTYLICRLPFVIWFVILQLERKCFTHLNDHQSVIFLPFYYQFLYAQYSINFLVYCGVSRDFFWRVIWMITHCRRPKVRSDVDRCQETEMTNAGTISDNLERALELQARRASKRPYIENGDSLSGGSESGRFTGHSKQQNRRSTNDLDKGKDGGQPSDMNSSGEEQPTDGQTDQNKQPQRKEKQRREEEIKGAPESPIRTLSSDLERALEQHARQDFQRPFLGGDRSFSRTKSATETNEPQGKQN